MDLSLEFATRAIHAGQEPDPTTGAVIPPIYQVSTFKQDGVGNLRNGYEYSRAGNPTRTMLEECLASLEKGKRALAFASGLAAEDCVIRSVCAPGDRIIVPTDAYGGTIRLFSKVLSRWGIQTEAVDLSDTEALREALQVPTRLVWCESPTNPMLKVTDLARLVEISHAAGALVVVDNTFASPVLQQPLELGVDIVMHSTTKYIGGHSDVIGGALITNNDELAEEMRFHQFAVGAVPGPFDAWLTVRGIKTLDVRMQRHCDNAEEIVQFLQQHPGVEKVYYPGLDGNELHQMRRGGGMISFQVAGGEEKALEVCNSTRLFTLAESLGGVESLIELPGRMTHHGLRGTPSEVPPNLIRLSVGIEASADLIEDLGKALA
ncbi:cystathionine gamma-synthase [Arthrobacter sp. HLT1-20]